MFAAAIARWTPSLMPGIKALLNPVVLCSIMGATIAAFFYGVHVEGVRFEVFQQEVERQGEVAIAARLARIKEQDRITKENDRDHKKALYVLGEDLASANAAVSRLLNDPGRRLVTTPTNPAAGGSGLPEGVVCYKADDLNRRLESSFQRFVGRAEAILRRGDVRTLQLLSCATWAVEQGKVK